MSQAGNNRDDLLKFGNVVARRGESHDWLNWKAEKEERWIRAGVAVSFIAMIAAILAAVFAFLSPPR
jgi:hypothetical protein